MTAVAPDGTGMNQGVLRETFNMIDTDGSGSIDNKEFGCLLRLQGEDVTDEDAKEIMAQIDLDGDGTSISFTQFEKIMSHIDAVSKSGSAGNKFDLASVFADNAKTKSTAFQAKDPLWLQLQRKREQAQAEGVKFSSSQNARMALAGMVDGNTSQVLLIALIIIDVVAVLCELLIVATECPCTEDMLHHDDHAYSSYSSYSSSYSAYSTDDTSSSYSSSYSSYSGDDSSRRLSWAQLDELNGSTIPQWLRWAIANFFPALNERVYPNGRQLSGGCVYDKERDDYYAYSEEQHDWHIWLAAISVSILVIFAIQVAMLVLLYGFEFFKNPFYVLDLVVTYGGLTVELTIKAKEGGLFVLLLLWRFLRVFHGLMSSLELSHKREHDKIKAQRAKTLQFIVGTRRKGAAKHMYYKDFHDMLKKQYGVVAFEKKGYHANLHRNSTVGTSTAAAADDGKVHTDAGHKLEEAMMHRHATDFAEREEPEGTSKEEHEQHEKEDVEELMAEMAAEELRRKAAEAMYVELYAHLEEHLDSLKKHTDGLHADHGHGEHGEGDKHDH